MKKARWITKSFLATIMVVLAASSVVAAPVPPPHPPVYGEPMVAFVEPSVSAEAAEKTAFDRVGGGVLTKLAYKVDKHGFAKYDIHIYKDGYDHKVDINAMTGEIYRYEQKMPKMPKYQVGAVRITRKQAEAIALKRSGGGTIVGYKLDLEKTGRAKYDVDIVNNGMKYDFKIDANTGEIFKFKQESIRQY